MENFFTESVVNHQNKLLKKLVEPPPLEELKKHLDVAVGDMVYLPPRFVNKVRNAYLVEGEDVQFTCTVEGAPRPQIRWYKDGVLLKDTSKYQTFSEPRSGITVLVVKNPSNEDMGHYECE
ncbi:hypothetical protein HGM15179_022372, partial [Zosterops borbonicus]